MWGSSHDSLSPHKPTSGDPRWSKDDLLRKHVQSRVKQNRFYRESKVRFFS
jgi:hypothetical protein